MECAKGYLISLVIGIKIKEILELDIEYGKVCSEKIMRKLIKCILNDNTTTTTTKNRIHSFLGDGHIIAMSISNI